MPALRQVLLAFWDAAEIDVRNRQHLLDRDPSQLLQHQCIGMGVNRSTHEQIAANLAAGRLGRRLVDAQLVNTGGAFEMEVE